jgi:phosphate starvation-inducible PhoH-like protein
MLVPGALKRLMELNIIQLAPIAYMRGRTLEDAFIVLDEAQNTSSGQMKMVLTRLGERSTMVITGDDTQVDLPHGSKSGLVVARERLAWVDPDIAICVFGPEDVVRHRLVKVIVKAFG